MLLDIGVGILSAIAIHWLFSLSLSTILIASGVLFSLLPDADYVFHVLKNWRLTAPSHRDKGIHYPLFYIPFGMGGVGGIAWTFIGSHESIALVALFGTCSLLHFFHDSIGIGWGIQWLWPLRSDHYTFFYRYTSPRKEAKLPRKILYIWKHDELKELSMIYTDQDILKDLYLYWFTWPPRLPHPYFLTELTVFLVSLGVLYLLM